MPIDQYIRLKRLARRLDVHPKTIGRWVREGRFPAPTYVAGQPLWREADVLVFMEKQKAEPPPPVENEPEGGGGEHSRTSDSEAENRVAKPTKKKVT